MKSQKLIKKLLKQPNLPVCVVDWRKNIHHADDEPQGHGIESKFDIQLVHQHVSKPFIALSFINDDYDEQGQPDPGSSIYDVITRSSQDEDVIRRRIRTAVLLSIEGVVWQDNMMFTLQCKDNNDFSHLIETQDALDCNDSQFQAYVEELKSTEKSNWIFDQKYLNVQTP